VTRNQDTYPVRWMGRQAIVALPEQIDVTNAGQIREELLLVINQGALAHGTGLGARPSPQRCCGS
jgi:hypothetical protein